MKGRQFLFSAKLDEEDVVAALRLLLLLLF